MAKSSKKTINQTTQASGNIKAI